DYFFVLLLESVPEYLVILPLDRAGATGIGAWRAALIGARQVEAVNADRRAAGQRNMGLGWTAEIAEDRKHRIRVDEIVLVGKARTAIADEVAGSRRHDRACSDRAKVRQCVLGDDRVFERSSGGSALIDRGNAACYATVVVDDCGIE